MKFPFLKSCARCWIAAGCILAAGFPAAAHAQLGALKKAVANEEPAKPAAAAEKPEDARKRLEQWHQEARDVLAKLDAPGADATLPVGVTLAELDDRRRDLEQMALTATRSIKNFNATADARKTLEASRAEDAGWIGFKEAPPYSLLMIDELLNERDAIKVKLTSNESSLSNLESILSGTVGETKAAEEAVSERIVALQNADDSKSDAAKWRLEAARTKARLLAARAGMMQNARGSLNDLIAAAKIDLALLDRKVKIARTNASLSEDDIARISKISDERKNEAQKEIRELSKRLKAATTIRSQAQAALDALLASATPDKEPEGLQMAKFRVEVAENRIDGIQSMIESLETLIQLENVAWKAQQDRKTLTYAANFEERTKSIGSIKLFHERLSAWENVIGNDISTCGADLRKLESRAASISSDDPRYTLVNEQRATASEKLAMLQRVEQAVVAQRRLVKRWIEEHSPKPGEADLSDRISAISGKAWETVKKIWAFEVMTFEEKVEIDGETLTGKIPVTLGMLLRALLFFLIGYWIASKIVRRIQTSLVTRGHIAEAQAKTLRNWLMIAVGVCLAIGTLSFLKIPLTVFAFFGGALAIGLGFGTQTLIKNFISGIIVLAERKVRVGDILDVDGIIGTVVEVNTRSSVIRGADDVETMIPNSLFLENRVTNWTLSSSKMRRSLRVGVAYGTESQTVMEILTEAAARHGLICKHPAPFAIFEDFGDNALIFSLYFWLDLGGSTSPIIVTSDLRLMIQKCFTEAGVGIPFPQRDMHLTTDQPIQVQISNPPA
jgi:small-conductance mechanosensitive channel